MVRHVVAHGYPAPAVYAAAGSDIVMERLHGPTLLQSLAAGETSIHDGADAARRPARAAARAPDP